jgi:hypothetical protein
VSPQSGVAAPALPPRSTFRSGLMFIRVHWWLNGISFQVEGRRVLAMNPVCLPEPTEKVKE